MATFVIGDIHGQRDQAAELLRGVGLLDADERWRGGDAALWFIGDFFDRGPDGIGAVELAMRLQDEAAAAGGYVGAILGNHEVLTLAAYYLGERPSGGPGGTFRSDWLHNGGQASDLERLRPEHIEWIRTLPSMMLAEDRLLVHADALFYAEYGHSVDEVNGAIHALLYAPNEVTWDTLLVGGRFDFFEHNQYGVRQARQFLRTFGGRQIIHGHTPIWKMIDVPAEEITEAYIYADGLCVNVDGGMVTGGPGFVYEVPPLTNPM
jgi:diadenosine tetraphosphatase ApaH/serine/threonine PP2A family protein phosphatase